ncbi:MAG: SAM-dependent methyltransferase [Planctomyces sp.]|nr:SAM-dependent methyltransferase [Planctomyces sp.]
MRLFPVVASIALMLLSGGAFAQEPATPETTTQAQKSVKPGINDAFLDPNLDVDEWVNRFEVESREVFQARHEIIERLKLKAGDRIADIGTGTGLFVEPFAHEVGESGWVYALDIAPKFVERVEKIAQVKKLDNVTPVLCGQDDIRLAPGTIDVAFICDVYHHFEQPDSSLASIHEALTPDGKLVVIDFERIPGESREWTLDHVRAGKEVFRSEIENAGFHFVEEVEVPSFKENYFLVFERK